MTSNQRSEVSFSFIFDAMIGQSQKILELNSTIIELKEVIT
jgi:hypothetical protein